MELSMISDVGMELCSAVLFFFFLKLDFAFIFFKNLFSCVLLYTNLIINKSP